MEVCLELCGSVYFVPISEHAKIRDLRRSACELWEMEDDSFFLRAEDGSFYQEEDAFVADVLGGDVVQVEPNRRYTAKRVLREHWKINGDYANALIALLNRCVHGVEGARFPPRPTASPAPSIVPVTTEDDIVVPLLWDCIDDINETDTWGSSLLVRACDGGHQESVSRLLDMGADVNMTNHARQTPLICAAKRGHIGIAALLITRGAVVDTRDANGWTAWMHSYAASPTGAAYLRDLSQRGFLRCIWEAIEMWSDDVQFMAALSIGTPVFLLIYLQSEGLLSQSTVTSTCGMGALLGYIGLISFVGARLLICAMSMACVGGLLSRVLKFFRDMS